ncbi:MDR family MFS transporter [Cupriavidus agavae]|uniref:EmrB/QacA subfamily drug resistance transporter n=1 Tax=Cupriavidus agavae TaxID=1001822 RepID=A0A4Q7RYS5_9BURK|nr:MDR family MFS transporter [Cupriavidus agavae]RZT38477.1 EmrB/QacA subfamily drug resistance transporter [Cupriavidus agavae]
MPPPTSQAPASASVASDLPAVHDHAAIMRVIGGIVLCILLAALDQTVVIPAVPAIATDLNGFGHLSWIVTAYLIVSTVSTPLYGKLSDSFGRRRLLMMAIALFIAASVACAMAQSLTQLILFRALQGVGGGGLMSLAQAAIADVVAPRQRGRYQGYLATVWAVSSIAGPLVGGWVADHLSWRWLFWINVPLGLLAMGLCYRGLSQLRPRGGRPQVDWLGAFLLAVAIVAFLLAMSWAGEAFDWISLEMGALLLVTAAAVALLAWQERRAPDAMLPPRLFRNRAYVMGVGASALAALNIFLCIFALPLHFQLVRDADASLSGLLVVPFLLSTVAGNFVVAWLAPRLGRMRGILTGGYVAAAAGLAALAAVTAAVPTALVLLAMTVAGVGLGMTMVGTLICVQNALERRDMGAGTGALLVLRSLGSAIGGALAGTLLAMEFRGALARAGVTQPLDLGALRHGSEAMAQLSPAVRQVLAGGVESGFHLIFAAGAVAAVVALLIVRRMPDLELRSAVTEHASKIHMD